MYLALLPLLVFPFLELWLMIAVGDAIGALAVILWVVTMIIIGTKLLRYVGPASMVKVAQDMRAGKFPGGAIADGVLKAVGALLLIVPGFITDIIALFCFIPLFRRLVLLGWARKLSRRATGFTHRESMFRRPPFDRAPSAGASRRGNIYEHNTGIHHAEGGTYPPREDRDLGTSIQHDRSPTDKKTSP